MTKIKIKVFFTLKEAYSFVEVIISISIIAMLLVMLFNIVIQSIKITKAIVDINFIENEISVINSVLDYDFKNADVLSNCNISGTCSFFKDNNLYEWKLCDQKICKFEIKDGQNYLVNKLGANINVFELNFYKRYVLNGGYYLYITILYEPSKKNFFDSIGLDMNQSLAQIVILERIF